MTAIDLWSESDNAWSAASALQQTLEHREGLPRLGTPFHLAEGELAHVSTWANCSWYGPSDVVYEHRQCLAFGSLGLLGLTVAASVIGNRRRRAEADALAAPQWRIVGCLPVLLTSQRVMLQIDGAWTSLWLSDMLHVVPLPAEARLELVVEDCPPVSLGGPWVPYLCVALAYLLRHEVLDLHQSLPTSVVIAWVPRASPVSAAW